MIKKISLIAFLAIGFGLLLYFKPWQTEIKSKPRLVDRLPEAEYIGSFNPLQLSKEIADFPSFKDIKFRQFLNYDFLISQSRSLGINLQSSVYFFIHEDLSWGILLEINDSKKLKSGISKFIESFNFKTFTEKNKTIHELSEAQLSITYGEEFLVIYKGEERNKVFEDIFNAEFNSTKGIWKRFHNLQSNASEAITLYSEGKKLKTFGFESILLRSITDSTNVIFNTVLTKENAFNIEIKNGRSLDKDFSKNAIDIQLDISNFRDKKNDLLYKQLENISAKYGLPFIDFLDVWEGEFSFREGDYIRLDESYFETVVDEEFNTVLEEKIRTKYIPEYNIFLSNNNKFRKLIELLIRKRVAIQEADSDKYRFLLSPPMSLKKSDTVSYLYSGHQKPAIKTACNNRISWELNNVRYNFQLDSLQEEKAFGKIFFDFSSLTKFGYFQ